MHELSQRSRNNMNGIDPRLIAVAEEAIAVSPVDFGIPEDGGVRADERQNQLFKLGKSKADGYKKKSKHQPAPDGYGKALDVFAYVNGRASWDMVHLAIIAGVFFAVAARRGVKLRWGGTFGSTEFKGWDAPHFEIMED